MRILKNSGFTYQIIINDSISLNDLENFLQYKVFNSQQFINIMEHLIKNNQFSPKCQANLMRNKALYEVESINYLKDLLLKFDFTSQAVCIFLKNMEARLDHKYIDKLIEKYGESPSVLFSVGKFHKYIGDESYSLCKHGYNFIYKGNPYRQLNQSSMLWIFILSI